MLISGKNKKSGFTLVELLVVIAIISILAGMLLPALETALNSARSMTCMGNMKQVGLAMTLYLDDHDGGPPPRTHEDAGGSVARSWPKVLGKLYLGQDDIDLNNEKQGYDGVLICPTDAYSYPDHPEWKVCYGSYGPHRYSMAPLENDGSPSGVIPYIKWNNFIETYGGGNSGALLAIFESTGGYRTEFNWNTGYGTSWEHRHPEEGEGMNLLFADFHAEYQFANPGGTTSYSTYDIIFWKAKNYYTP
ncbi:MAG: prepilin-type N-terminal cleavage/methylation domain-containing protein [Planctomycetota bacterium]|jgi:prepilin-type N-terminal cleavage/methylation domain-containing protein/prepilin-type processing-associated H-X9-DG protein